MSLDDLLKDARFGLGLLRRQPFSVLLQVTNRCNMTCSFCDFWPHPAPRGEELTLDDYRRLAGELDELGCFLISIEGGEPMVRKDLPAIIAALSARHLTVLFTNGWYLTPPRAAELWEAGLTTASVSIDYAEAARHDEKRGLPGATARAWQAVELLRDSAPRGGKQVQVMTVLMDSNWRELDRLLQQSASHGVGHQLTLLASGGYRRGKGPDRLPPPECVPELLALYDRHSHLRFFREYFANLGPFLSDDAADQKRLPTCQAGKQGFNIDHVGNVAPCIERIGEPVGNVKQHSLATLHARLAAVRPVVSQCQDCMTACRGFQQALGDGGSLRAFKDLSLRMRASG